ncbi:MAG: replication initiator protein [Arizlama microvirus]|nr:MAG: replication initiator protein [Arizlama microvirus]QXP08385.1 MAG: replication initiator protein [Arizlama microvirus]
MPCYHPIEVPRRGHTDLTVQVACGRCIGCRLDKSRDWATRCVHEASLHEDSCFVTLTYSDEKLPPGGSLRPRDFTLFMKRLRKARSASRIRFFHCGEYGERTARPHYHALLFGVSFPDKRTCSKGDFPLYSSQELDKLWGHGTCTIGALTHQSAAYCARYVMKKVSGDLAPDHYRYTDPATGEVFDLHHEYATMSRRPGLGHDWVHKFMDEVYHGDFVATKDGGQVPVPVYYDNELRRTDPDRLERIKKQRFARAISPKERANSTPRRLAVREEVKKSAISQLRRKL